MTWKLRQVWGVLKYAMFCFVGSGGGGGEGGSAFDLGPIKMQFHHIA